MPLDEIPEAYFQGGAHLAESQEPVAIPRKPTLRVILNEIVSAINALEAAPAGETVKVNLVDTVAALLEDKILAGTGISATVVDKGGGDLAIEISAPGSTTDEKVKVSLTDSTTGLLVEKIVDAHGDPLVVYGAGGDEKLQLPTSGTGWVYVTDVVALGGGEVGAKTWQNTGETVLQSVISSVPDLRLSVVASYPLVKIGGSTTELSRDPDGGHYAGDVDVTFSGGDLTVTVVTPNDEDGAEDTVNVTVESPPTLVALNFQGAYPTGPGGLQTEVAEDNSFEISVVADKNFDCVRVLDYEACKLEEFPVSPAASSHVVSSTIADRGDTAVMRPARVQVRDSVTGAWSATRDTNFGGGTGDGTHVVNCNNLPPTNSFGSPSYPGSQQALKGSEQATVPITVANYDSLVVTPIGGELTIIDDFPPSIIVERAGGTYNVSTANLQAVATRNANGRQITDTVIVQIAAVAPTVNVNAAARLRSGGNDGTSVQDHVIEVESTDQLLLSVDMDEDTGGGTFTGSWSGSPPDSTWTRVLQVHDDDAKGTYSWQNLVATNLAGIVQNTISSGSSYELGGFVPRTIVVPAFASSVQFGAEVADFSKVQAGNFSPGGPSVKMPIGTTADTENGYTIDAVGINPTTLVLLDQDAIAANSLGLYNLQDLEEVI